MKGAKNADGRDFWVEAGRVRGSIYEYTVTGLETKSEYLVRIKAINESGASPERDAFPSVVCEDAAVAPEANLNRLYNKTLTVRAEQQAIVEFPFIGSPKPKIQFFKGEGRERQIFNGEGKYLVQISNDVATLRVQGTDKSDTDTYPLALKIYVF